jgi:hypothetical protein
MKFSEKFELLESLTTGAIETFAANDKVRGQRVLVHIVECAAQKPEQSITEWVLESFRRLAPEPAGPVLESGRYSGAQYAYLVTKPADEAAVKSWVRRYELHSQERKETSTLQLKQQISGNPPTPAVPPMVAPREPQPAPGQMTQLFQDFDSLAKSRSTGVPERKPPARPVNLAGESGLHSAAPWDPASLKPAAPPKERIPDSFSTAAKPVAPERPASSVREGPKPGEFTSFFQGPFRGDAPSAVPAFSSEPIEPPRKNVGEFTAMFGSATPQPAESAPASNAPASSFTGLFKDMEKPQPAFHSNASPAGGVIPSAVEPFPVRSAPKDQNLSPQAPIFVSPPPPVVTAPPPVVPVSHPTPTPAEAPMPSRSTSLPGDGATGAFMRPSAEPAPIPAPVPSGPSPYTQIISRQKFSAEEAAEADAQTPGSPAGGGGFAAPPMPMIPAAAPPPIPKIPPPPPMPKTRAKPPAGPKAPKLDAAPPPPVSYWPLIITLTVLFFLAVLLVLYFMMKH